MRKLTFPFVMKSSALAAGLLTLACILINRVSPRPWLVSCAVTFGTFFYHFAMRLLAIKSLGGLQWFQVDMGENTTTRTEIANRKIRGMISLQFTQALEIIDLEFVVYSSALDMEATTT